MNNNGYSKRLVIFGCGGHARSVIDVGILIGWNNIIIIDENCKPGEKIMGFPTFNLVSLNDISQCNYFVAIGENYMREKITLLNHVDGMELINIISPYAYVSKNASIQQGTFIGNFAHIGPEAIIGVNTIINTHAIIEHECSIGNNTHVAIGACVAGRVSIGDYCLIGAGASIRENLYIADNVTIGAGAVVVKNIDFPGIYVGNPIKKI